MLYAIAVVLIVPWLFGLVTSYTMAGVIHVPVVVALAIVPASFFARRRRA